MKDFGRVGILAAGNLVLAGVGNFLSGLTAILQMLLVVGQVGVATMTILYIYRKIKALKKAK